MYYSKIKHFKPFSFLFIILIRCILGEKASFGILPSFLGVNSHIFQKRAFFLLEFQYRLLWN